MLRRSSFLACEDMTNAIYPRTKKRFMEGDIDLTTVPVYAALINVSGPGTTYAYSAAHGSLADLPAGAIISTSPALTGKALGDDASFDSDDPTFAIVTGQTIEAVILYADDGTNSYLVMYQDTSVTGLPLTPDGSDVQVLVDEAGWFAL